MQLLYSEDHKYSGPAASFNNGGNNVLIYRSFYISQVHSILARMELRINEEKSGIVEAKKAPFDFLGFTIRYDKLRTRDGRYWNIIPSEKSCKKVTQ